MKKEDFVTFAIGLGFFFILSVVLTTVGTIWLDMNNVSRFELGRGIFKIYSFSKSEQGFDTQTHAGIFFVAISGGLISVILKKSVSKWIVVK